MTNWEFVPAAILRSAGFPASWALLPGAPEDTHADRLAGEREEIRRRAGDPAILEAIWLQSPEAFRAVLELSNSPSPPARTSKFARRERLALKYLQRFAMKNDSHSFFGPTACAGVADLGVASGVAFEPGRDLVSSRRVYFGHWAANGLADVMRREDPTGWFRRVRLAPGTLVDLDEEGGFLRSLSESRSERREFAYREGRIGGLLAILLRQAVQGLPWDVFAKALLRIGLPEDRAAELLETGVVEAELVIPTGIFDPLAWLRSRLEAHPDPSFAARWLEAVRAFEEALETLLAESPGERRAAQTRLEAAYETVSGRAAARGAGEFYVDRFLYFERCGRDLRECAVDRGVLERFRPVLGFLGDWAWGETRLEILRYRRWFEERFAGRDAVPLVEAMGQFDDWRSRDPASEDPALAARLEALAAFVGSRVEAAANQGAPEVEIPLESLRELLPDEGPAPVSRYFSADLLVAGPASPRRWILGEIHQKLGVLDDVPPSSDRDLHLARIASALEGLAPAGTELLEIFLRHQTSLDCREADLGQCALLVSGGASIPPERIVLARDVEVVRRDTGLSLRSIDPSRELAPIGLYAHQGVLNYLSPIVGLGWARGFLRAVRPEGPFRPRVVVESVVVARAAWTATGMDLFGRPRRRRVHSSAEDPARLASWRKRVLVPRFVFLRPGPTVKPVFLDLESPLYVELLSSFLSDGEAVLLEEMLPGPEDLVLTDAALRAYTSELRSALVSPGRRE